MAEGTTALTPPAAEQVEAHNREVLDALVWAIASAQEFALLFAKCNLGTQRHALIEDLEARLQADGITSERVCLTTDDDPLPLLARVCEDGPPGAILLEGMELLDANDPVTSTLASLNLYRERYGQVVPCPLVIWTTDIGLSRLADAAPDFFRWRSGVFEFHFPRVDSRDFGLALGPIASDWELSAMSPVQRRQRLEDLRGVLKEMEDLPPTAQNRRERARVLLEMGQLLHVDARYREAIECYEQSLEIERELGERREEGRALNDLAVSYRAMGRHEEAEPLYRQAMEIRREALGEEHPDYAESLSNMAVLCYALGRYEEAEPLCRQALEIRRKALGEEHPDYAVSLDNLAVLYDSMARYEEAELLLRQAVEVRRQALGEDHPDYGRSLNNLAGLYHALGRYQEVEPLYRQAVDILEKALGEDHPHTKTCAENLEECRQRMGANRRGRPSDPA